LKCRSSSSSRGDHGDAPEVISPCMWKTADILRYRCLTRNASIPVELQGLSVMQLDAISEGLTATPCHPVTCEDGKEQAELGSAPPHDVSLGRQQRRPKETKKGKDQSAAPLAGTESGLDEDDNDEADELQAPCDETDNKEGSNSNIGWPDLDKNQQTTFQDH